MPVFAINFLLIFVWAALVQFTHLSKQSKERLFFGIVFVQFLLISGLRTYDVGQDLRNYLQGYRDFQASVGNAFEYYFPSWEPGYILINIICSKIGLSFRLFFLLIDAFAYLILFRFIRRYAPVKWLAVVLFVAFGFFFASLHILRQTIALSIILLSYDALVERKTRRFFILVFLAFCFHYTAILFAASYFLYRGRRMSLGTFIVLFVVIGILSTVLFSSLMGVAILFMEKYDGYGQNDLHGSGYSMLALLLVLVILGYAYKPRDLSKKDGLIFFAMAFGTILQMAATKLSIFARVCWYWEYAVMAYIPVIIALSNNKHSKLILKALAILFSAAFFFLVTNSHEGKASWATYELMK